MLCLQVGHVGRSVIECELRIITLARTREKGPHGHRAQPVALRLANDQWVWGVENLFQTTEHESCCKRDTETRLDPDVGGKMRCPVSPFRKPAAGLEGQRRPPRRGNRRHGSLRVRRLFFKPNATLRNPVRCEDLERGVIQQWMRSSASKSFCIFSVRLLQTPTDDPGLSGNGSREQKQNILTAI